MFNADVSLAQAEQTPNSFFCFSIKLDVTSNQ